ncbi:hypothetical protein BV22DRAFT_1032056 [Leucogyrophana mollusca]|uniref:Uncharacterized protein n=1 Tax=Leucogyrophana mollusca TaxID=85980 RepID=A0ACB8BMP4_9AGAM|nr:hypothetical protein BV22DRAFT_1032056 [Leucogyrophana mollusca]
MDDFFAEQEKRMNLPDEDMDEYIRQRLEFQRKRRTLSWANEDAPGIDNSSQTQDHRAEPPRETAPFTRTSELSRTVAKEVTAPSPPDSSHESSGNLKRKSVEVTALDKRRKQEDPDGKFAIDTVSPAMPSRNESAEIPHENRALIDGVRGKRASTTIPRSKSKTDLSRTFTGEMRPANTKGGQCSDVRVASEMHNRSVATPNEGRMPSRYLNDSPLVGHASRIDPSKPRNRACSSNSLVNAVVDTPLARPVASATMPPTAWQSLSKSSNQSIAADQSMKVKTVNTITAEGSSTFTIAYSPGANASSSRRGIIGDTPEPSAVDGGNTRRHAPSFLGHPATIFPDQSRFIPQATSTQLPLQEYSPLREPSDAADPMVVESTEPRGATYAQNVAKGAPANVSTITSPGNTPSHAHKRMSSSDIDIAFPSSSPAAESSKGNKAATNNRTKASVSKPKIGKKSKEKPPLMTPLEYAQKLQAQFEPDRPRKTNYLEGKRIFYVGGDMQFASPKTRGRMDYIVKHGGTLVPSYDPSAVTHIVTDANSRPTLRALGLKSLTAIPVHIPTVTWSWVISGLGRTGRKSGELKGKDKANHDVDGTGMDFEFLHAAFHERIDAGTTWQKLVGKRDGEGDSGDFSRISDFTQDTKIKNAASSTVLFKVLPPAPLNLTSPSEKPGLGVTDNSAKPPSEASGKEADPLADFYAMAKAERDAAWGQDQEDSDDGDGSDGDIEGKRGPIPRRGFICDKKEPQQHVCANQDIIDKLEELMELHKAKPSDDDRWRVFSYSKCIRALRSYPKRIKSFSQARAIKGVGEKTALKIMEIIETGGLRRIAYAKTDDVEVINVFQGVYGVGRQTAFMWYASGCRTLDDVKARKGGIKLSTVQEIGVRFYDDINSRMSRSEAEKIFNMIKPIALDFDAHLFVEIMGSFRRGKPDCGDIDILITRRPFDGKTHAGVLPEILAALHSAKILTEDLSLPEDFSALELSYRGLCRLPEPNSKRRRIDILCVPWESRGAALLYYTGDDIFNRAMRMKANVLGYSLNQRGLYGGVVRDPRDRRVKVSEGNIVASETEEEIFKILGVPWQEPRERVRG